MPCPGGGACLPFSWSEEPLSTARTRKGGMGPAVLGHNSGSIFSLGEIWLSLKALGIIKAGSSKGQVRKGNGPVQICRGLEITHSHPHLSLCP